MTIRTGHHARDTAGRLTQQPVFTEDPAGNSAKSRAPSSDLSTSLILLAEDDRDTRDFLTLFLRKSGFQVLPVADGEEAIRALEDHRPDLFILDCQMPGKTGLEVCQTVRQLRDFGDTPVIFLTALTDPDSRLRGFAAGAADYVTKPVERVELLARIKTHLELSLSRRLLREHAVGFEAAATRKIPTPREVQSSHVSLLARPADYPEIKFATRLLAKRTTGGVFHEVLRLGDGDFGLLVAEVAAGTLVPTYMTGVLKTLCAVFLQDSLAPGESFRLINAHLPGLLGGESRVAVSYARYSRSRMTVDLLNAGHPPPIWHRSGQSPQCITSAGSLVGAAGPSACDSTQLQVHPGDRLYLYTAGLIPRFAGTDPESDAEALGDRMAQRIKECGWQPIDQTLDALVAEARSGSSDSLVDDFMVLALEC